MFDVFGSVKTFIKLDSVCIDNDVFRLHYKATVIILVAFSLLVTSKQYIGDPIDCIVEGVPANVMDTYCWIHSTFSIVNRPTEVVGKDVPHFGTGPEKSNGQDEIRQHKYYQWVCFVLFFQALLFYIPRYLWKNWESGKIKNLLMSLSSPILDEKSKEEQLNLVTAYFKDNLHNQNFYAFRFFFCEVLNFINVVGQIYFMDTFLGGEFTTYGSRVVSMTEMEDEKRVDPMALVFPKVTKCTFHKFGASGTVQKIDGLCVLPVNIVNEKIYVFLWFWFVILAVITGIQLVYRIAVIVLGKLRALRLRVQARFVAPQEIDRVANRCQIGDWFVLNLLAKNMDALNFKEFVDSLANQKMVAA